MIDDLNIWDFGDRKQKYTFYNLQGFYTGTTVTNSSSNLVYQEVFQIAATENKIKRNCENIFDVLGRVGGLTKTLIYIAAIFMKPLSKITYQFEAIFKFFKLKSKTK